MHFDFFPGFRKGEADFWKGRAYNKKKKPPVLHDVFEKTAGNIEPIITIFMQTLP